MLRVDFNKKTLFTDYFLTSYSLGATFDGFARVLEVSYL